jgi:hypothetical protein
MYTRARAKDERAPGPSAQDDASQKSVEFSQSGRQPLSAEGEPAPRPSSLRAAPTGRTPSTNARLKQRMNSTITSFCRAKGMIAMSQKGQLVRLRRTGRTGDPLWAYRYRVGGQDSKRVQRGGFASERDAAEALEHELERQRRERRVSRSMTLAELVEAYLAQHDVEPVTIEKLRWLLGKAVAAFGGRPVGELRSEEIAAWQISLSAGYRFDATQALRQVLARAVVWGMIDANPAKLGVDNPSPRRRGAAPVRVLGRTRHCGRESLALLSADGDLRLPPGFVRPNGSRSNGATSTWRRGSYTSTARSPRAA